MISKQLKTTDGIITISIPSLLSEITLGMLIKMQEHNSDIETISILSGIPVDELYNVRSIQDFDTFTDHVLSLVHQIKYESDTLPLPKHIFVLGRKIEVVGNLSIEPAGAFMECRNLIADEINANIKEYGQEAWDKYFEENGKVPVEFQPSLNTAALILAHYLYCPTTGLPYDDEKAELFKEEILKLSITLTIPIAKYFFLSYPNLWKPKVKFLQVVKQTWREKLASKRSKYFHILIPLILWLTGT